MYQTRTYIKQCYCPYFTDEKPEVQGHRGSNLLSSKAIIFCHNPEGAVVDSEVIGYLLIMKFSFSAANYILLKYTLLDQTQYNHLFF